MSWYITAVLAGALLAIANNIADIFTIIDFESINGPIIRIPKDNLESAMHNNNRLRNMVIAVTYHDKQGIKQMTYLQTPVNFMSVGASSQESLLLKALRRNNEKPRGLIKYTSIT